MSAAGGFPNLERDKALKQRMKIIPALTVFVPAGHCTFELPSFQLCLTSPQFYHGTVRIAGKTEIRVSIHVICTKKKQVLVFQNSCKIHHEPPFGVCHTHSTSHLSSKSLGSIFTSEQHTLTAFWHRLPWPSHQDYPKSTTSVCNCTWWAGTPRYGSELLRAISAQKGQAHHDGRLYAVSSDWAPGSLKYMNWWRPTQAARKYPLLRSGTRLET